MARKLALLFCLLVFAGCTSKNDAGQKSFHTISFRIDFAFWRGEVVELTEDGNVVLERKYQQRRFKPRKQTYLCLAVPGNIWTQKKEFDVELIKARLERVDSPKRFVLKLPDSARKRIGKGSLIVLLQTRDLKADDLEKVPDGSTLAFEGMTARDFLQIRDEIILKNNLHQIGLAFHMYHDENNALPPAVIYGPDRKPWHSWRVLLLPYLDQRPLYDKYRFEEPWDSPHNLKVAETIPPVYRKPLSSDEFSHVVVAGTKRRALFKFEQGELHGNAAFLSEPDRSRGFRPWPQVLADMKRGRMPYGRQFRGFVDGLTNSLLVGFAHVEGKNDTPWTKPVDLDFDTDVIPLGKPGGFAASHRYNGQAYGLFCFADGRVTELPASLPLETLRKLVLINDGYPVGELPDAGRPHRESRDRVTHIEIAFTGERSAPIGRVREYEDRSLYKLDRRGVLVDEKSVEPDEAKSSQQPERPQEGEADVKKAEERKDR